MPWTPPDPNPADARTLQAQDKLIKYLATDSDFLALYDGQLLDDDPGGITIDDGLNSSHDMKIALVVAGESSKTGTLGLRSNGTSIAGYYLSLMIYLFDDMRDPVLKRKIVNVSNQVMNIMLRYQLDPQGTEMWYRMIFRDPAITYHTTNNFRQSVLILSLLNRIRNS